MLSNNAVLQALAARKGFTRVVRAARQEADLAHAACTATARSAVASGTTSDRIKAKAARLAAGRAETDWARLETAARDGTVLLAWA